MSIRRLSGSNVASAATPWWQTKAPDANRSRFSGWCAVLLGAIVSCWLCGCAQNEYEQALALSRAEQPGVSFVGPESVPDDLRELDFAEIDQGAGTEHLGAARMLREVGLLEFLESYIINIPPSAQFLAGKELHAATHDHGRSVGRSEPASAAVIDFEHRVLVGASGAQGDLWQEFAEQLGREVIDEPSGETGLGELHEAFFETLEQCGRESPWPDVKLFVMANGYAADYLPQSVERDFDISYFEYRELLYMCGRYAASYPSLDAELRDELLAPQRAHYAQVILDVLDNLLPAIEVPSEYQVEVDELRRSGW